MIDKKYDEIIISAEEGRRERFLIGLQGLLNMRDGIIFSNFIREELPNFMKTGKIPVAWKEQLYQAPNFKFFLNRYL